MNLKIAHKSVKISLSVFLAVIILFGAASLSHSFRRAVRINIQVTLAHLSRSATASFPSINVAHLNAVQQHIILLNKQEYAKRPISYDGTVLQYTQGSKEAWCADYASWIYKQAGIPFVNPNSTSWRIPGVYTLEAYFKSTNRWRSVTSYQPNVGDVAIYAHGDGHAAIVLARHGTSLITIGGNESGRLKLDTRPETGKNSYDLIGYGILN